MTKITDVLIEGLESWLSSHSEAATQNEELFFHVENKFKKLQNELNLCQGMVESLAQSDFNKTSSSTLPVRCQMLLDGLAQVATIKNELFSSSTNQPKASRPDITTKSQNNDNTTVDTRSSFNSVRTPENPVTHIEIPDRREAMKH